MVFFTKVNRKLAQFSLQCSYFYLKTVQRQNAYTVHICLFIYLLFGKMVHEVTLNKKRNIKA